MIASLITSYFKSYFTWLVGFLFYINSLNFIYPQVIINAKPIDLI